MAAPSYGTDLTTIDTGDTTTGWDDLSTWTAGRTPVNETDYFIQGTACVSKTYNATGAGGLVFVSGTTITIPTNGAVLVWQYFAAPNAMDTLANGGIRLIVGLSSSAFYAWKLGGKDTYTYGGWQCLAVDPSLTPDYTVGTPGTTKRSFGWAANLTNAIAKGNPFGVDVIRYGRCESRFSGGDLANGYATLEGFATVNDNQTNRWGLIQAVEGGYKWQGLMTLGYGSAVDFRISNRVVLIADTIKVSSSFNKIEIRQASSRVDMTNIIFQALGSTSRGDFEVIDDADVNLDGCTFTDMGTFIFKSNSTISSSTLRRTQTITQNSAVFNETTIAQNVSSSALVSNNPGNITNCYFISGGTGHAIEITTPGTYSFSGNSFSGYASSDGSTGNECIYNNSGGSVTLNISGGSTPTIRNGSGATTTVNNSITLTLTGLISGSDIVILNAGTTTERINVDANSGTTYNYGFSVGGNVDICVYKAGYVPFSIRNYTLPASNSTLPINQVLDRNFSD